MNQVHLAAITHVRHERNAVYEKEPLTQTLCGVPLVSNESRTFLESLCDHRSRNTCSDCLKLSSQKKTQPVLLLGTGW